MRIDRGHMVFIAKVLHGMKPHLSEEHFELITEEFVRELNAIKPGFKPDLFRDHVVNGRAPY